MPVKTFSAVVVLVALGATGCSSSTENAAPPALSSLPPVAVPSAPLPDEALSASLRVSLEALLAGAAPGEHLVGDRLMIITPDTFSEVRDTGSTGFLTSPFSLGGGCGDGACLSRLDAFLPVLLSDLRTGASGVAPVPVPSSLALWPSIVVSGQDRLWRVYLSSTADGLVAIEYFGPLPVAASSSASRSPG